MSEYLPGNTGQQLADLPCRAETGLAAYTGKWGDAEKAHLLKRTMFGVKKADMDHFKGKSLEQVVNELLNPAPFDETNLPVNTYDDTGATNIPFGKTWIGAPYRDPEDDGRRIASFMRWSFGVFISQDRSVREKLLLFWHNHFATQANVGRSSYIWRHHHLLRKHALGNFKELVRMITLDAQMLCFLNGEENTRTAPNENYSRELQELFCIGKGTTVGYTEDDVKEAARVLTGWKVDHTKEEVYFNPDHHDETDKKFSAFYNHATVKGRSGAEAGHQELYDLLDILFSHPETALFICRKLYRWFVYYKIDEATEKNVIIPLASLLRKNNYEIKPVLAALLKSEHFFDAVNAGAQIKSPLDFCIGLQREFDVEYAEEEGFLVNYSMWAELIDFCNKIGQVYANPPSVSGWPAYYQVPGFYELWINTTTYPLRNEFSSTMIDYGFNREGRFFRVDVLKFAASLSNPADPDELINESITLLYRVPVTDEAKKVLKKSALLSGQEQDHYWSDAWNDYIKNPDDSIKKGIVESRLKNLYRFMVNSPEYQLA